MILSMYICAIAKNMFVLQLLKQFYFTDKNDKLPEDIQELVSKALQEIHEEESKTK